MLAAGPGKRRDNFVMKQTFSQFCSELGLPLRNERWSWCALSEEKRQAVFTVWDDRLTRPKRDSIDFSWLTDPARTENGAREFRRVILRVIEEDFDAYGILCEAKDIEASPRIRKRFDRELLVMKIAVEDHRHIARICGKVDPKVVRREESVVDAMNFARSAIDDLNSEPAGNAAPLRTSYSGTFIVRDDKVRQRVIRRANGKCEFCGELGFLKADGTRYVEAHHIISLADQGPDTLENVIALCPNHHREAHFGENLVALEAEFLLKLEKLHTRRQIKPRSLPV
jgi:5-methylcytosine-specific restriction enzyme A